MKKTIVFSLLGVTALGALSLAVVGPRHAGGGDRPALASAPGLVARAKSAASVGYVVLPEAMHAHPLWAEVLQTDKAIERNRAKLGSVTAQPAPSSRGRSQVGAGLGDSVVEHVRELSASMSRSRAEQGAYVVDLPSEDASSASEQVLLVAHKDVAAKSTDLMSRAQGLIAENKQVGEQTYAVYKARLDAEYGPKMLTLRVKRCIRGSEGDLKAIDDDLSRFADEKAALLGAKATEISVASDKYSVNTMMDARRELDHFSAERYGRAEGQLARSSSAEQSKVLGDRAPGGGFPEISPVDAGAAQFQTEAISRVREKVFRARDEELRARKEELLKALQAEVRRGIVSVAKRRGVAVSLVATRPVGTSASLDLTQEVIRAGE